jgi:hypothetical protein
MSSSFADHSTSQASRWLWQLRAREPVFTAVTLALCVLACVTAVSFMFDPRMLMGERVWTKPLKFELSIAVFLGTLAIFAAWLPDELIQSVPYRRYSVFIAACALAEMTWLLLAAANGIPSHFNRSSAFFSAIYPVMGLVAIGLLSAALVYGIAFAWDRGSRLNPVIRHALASGLILTFALTLVVAGYMAAQPGHGVGGTQSDVADSAFLGWARGGGDLRVAHFFATHAMQAIPLCGVVAARLLPPLLGHAVVAIVSVMYAFGVAVVFVQAINGQPFLPGML